LVELILCLIWAGGLVFVAVGLGRPILYWADVPCVSPGEKGLFSFGLGLGVLGLAVFFLACAGFLRPGVIWGVWGICAVCGLAGWLRGKALRPGGPSRPSTCWFDRLVWGVLGLFLVLGLLLVLTPAIGKDALIYHLAVPKLLLKGQGFYFIEGNIFAHYPLGQEMLYVLAMVLQGEILAKCLHFVMTLAILFGMWQFGRDHVPGLAFVPVALLVFYTVPSVFSVSHMAYNDLAVTFQIFMALYAFVRWDATGKKGWLTVCGVFAGLAMSTKYTALFVPFMALLGILWNARRRKATWREALRDLMVFALPAVAIGSPFYVKNWLITGNPFYPFLYGIFGGQGLDPEQSRLYDLFVWSLGMGRQWIDLLVLPWNVSVHAEMSSPRFDGILGPVFLVTLPFAIALRKTPTQMKILMVFALLTFLFWASSAQQIRYLIPILPPLALVISYVLSRYRQRKVAFAVLAALVAGSLGFSAYHVIQDFRKIDPLRIIAGQEDRHAFVGRMIPSYEMYRTVNETLPEDAKVFLVFMKNYGYLCDRPCYSDSMFEAYTLKKILSGARSGEDVSLALREKGFTHLMYDDGYVTGEMSTLSSEDKALFSDFLAGHAELLKIGQGKYYLFRISFHP
jgi:hypothetical protein